MFRGLLSFIGDSNEKVLKKLRPAVAQINDVESLLEKLSDSELRAQTDSFRERLNNGESTDQLLPEAFAAVREAAKRVLGQRHFDVQLMGGMVLHQGKIAEMKTGEGKTLVATLPAYLNSLGGRGVHVITVNDYLAKRDTQWMGPIYNLLGVTVSCLQHESAFVFDSLSSAEVPASKNLRPASRGEAYLADIVFGTNSEFGFDYLRDNMGVDLSQCVQRDLHFAIVDEVDNILIDEARTPLIISGPAQESTKLYQTVSRIAPRLAESEDYSIDEKQRVVSLTESGIGKVEKWLNLGNLYDPANYILIHYIENALRAEVIFKLDRDYVVRDGEVIIVDEFTGRLMVGRRYSYGLHQAIEAKEGLKVNQESITYATITLQNYFRLYEKLAGMTGTASTEAEEFWKIYKLDVVAVPTHKVMVRRDFPDYIYKTEEAKFRAVVRDIRELYEESRPVLVGTVSIEKSERLSDMLKLNGIPHQVLNAKLHEKEAVIVAQAGGSKAVTVATNMAGRGTDIVLGGASDSRSSEEWQHEHNKVVGLGGVHIIGTERHESRRIDNQLRGRSGRQGDPGSSRFYCSLEDDLMRRFAGDRIRGIMQWAGLGDGVPIENALVSKAVESAQVKVEGFNFEIRKHLVDYDDVINKHREVIYAERRKVLAGTDLKTNVQGMVREEIGKLVEVNLPGIDSQAWTVDVLGVDIKAIFGVSPDMDAVILDRESREEIQDYLTGFADDFYTSREADMGSDAMRILERMVMLRVIDSHWVEHLTAVENLRSGVGLQAYGQRDPLVAYKTEGHSMFQKLLDMIRNDIVHTIFNVGITRDSQSGVASRATKPNRSVMANVIGNRRVDAVPSGSAKVSRNMLCPCGSGKKYKKCHGL
jgi:preprotein translocase subunit SecA